MQAFEIVGYDFAADRYCAGCIIDVLPTGPGGAFDGWALADGISMSVEDDLREIAFAFGIDYDDLGSYDSAEFPKPVFASQVEEDEYCGKCQRSLLDD